MGFLSVLAAAAGAWIFGAIWYGVMGKAWMAAAELTPEQIAQNRKNYAAFAGSFLCAVLVAGMMRHVFVTSGVDTMGKGILTGLGLGLFVATPWVVTNYLFAQRQTALMVIDGIYASAGCTIIGAVLVLL